MSIILRVIVAIRILKSYIIWYDNKSALNLKAFFLKTTLFFLIKLKP